MIRRAAVTRTVQPIDAISGLHEVMHPTGAATDAHHVRALAAAAVHHDHWISVSSLRRNHVLHVHLPQRNRSIRDLLALRSHPEAALVRQLDGRRLAIWMRIGRADYRGAL